MNAFLSGPLTAALAVLFSSLFVPFADAAGDKQLDLQTIFASDTFSAQLPQALQWLPSGNHYAFIENEDTTHRIVSRDVTSNQATTLLSLSNIKGLPTDFTLTDFRSQPQRSQFLLRGVSSTDWQGYQRALWYAYNSETKKLRPLGSADQAIELVKLSPDGKYAGFVFENNIFLVDLDSGKTTSVTSDGDGDIFNGVFDYGSTEFGPVDGWRWSPNGLHIAFWRMDATAVRLYPMIDELHSYSEIRQFHYPNASEQHAVNRIGVYTLLTAATQWIDVGHDADDYLAQMHWNSASDGLYIQQLTRDQNTLKLWLAKLGQKDISQVLEDTDSAWIDITNDLQAMGDETLLWTSEKSGYRHIYLVDNNGTQRPVTSGNWSVDAVLGLDEAAGWVYFYAKKDSLIDQHVYRASIKGEVIERMTSASGWHVWELSPNGKFTLATHSNAHQPQSLMLMSGDGKLVHPIVKNSVPAIDDYSMTHTEFVTFTTDDGIELNGFFIKPANFDPAKKYPVISYGYGNAGSQVVVNRWGTQRGPTQDLWHRYLAQRGYVVFAMDNRTTTGRGKAAKNLTYGEYGKYAVLDYIQGVDYLKTLPWVDASRIGFWGWSGGGYLAAA